MFNLHFVVVILLLVLDLGRRFSSRTRDEDENDTNGLV